MESQQLQQSPSSSPSPRDEQTAWQKRLHSPLHVTDLHQEQFGTVVSSTCDILQSCLFDSSSSTTTPTAVCALIIGAPSSGKSLLTRLVISQLEVASQSKNEFVIVSLSGLLHNTPSKAYQQLVHDLSQGTMSMPVDEHEEEGEGEQGIKDLIEVALDKLRQRKCGLLLVLDDIHRFANADPLAQTVLYSLLNLLQDGSLQAACIAQTPFVDVTNLLEKRVLSRLSHSKIIVPLPGSVDEVLAFVRHALIPRVASTEGADGAGAGAGAGVVEKGKDKEENKSSSVKSGGGTKRRGRPSSSKGRKSTTTTTNTSTGMKRSDDDDENGMEGSGNGVKDIDMKWQKAVQSLLEDERTVMAIRQYMVRSRIISPILRAIDAAISICIYSTPNDISIDLEEGIDILCESLHVTDTTIDAIVSLTHLELALLLSLRRVESRRSGSGNGNGSEKKVVFADVYAEYCKVGKMDEGMLADTDVSQPVVDRDVAVRAWESLVDGGLVIRVGSGGAREGRGVYCGVMGSQMDEAVKKHEAGAVMKQWAKQSVHSMLA